MLKTKIYIAGKITGDPNYKEKFSKMESELLKIPGTAVINPAALPTGLEPADYARICFAMIDSSDIVVFAPNYKKAKEHCLRCNTVDIFKRRGHPLRNI